MKKRLFYLFAITGLLLTSCTNAVPEDSNLQTKEQVNVMVSILPQVDFVERIGKEKVIVSEMIPPGFSPATHDPSPEQLVKLQNADIYFRIGHIPFEKAQMDRLIDLNPNMVVVDTSKDVPLLEMASHSHDHEEEHEDGEEHHENDEDEHSTDPHIWLSPEAVKIQARNIYEALVSYSPEDQEYFETNYNEFVSALEDLDNELENTFLRMKEETIFVFHPAFGYLADAYDFEQEAIEIEGKDPSPEHLRNIIDRANEEAVRVIFVQKQFSTRSAEAVADEIDGVVVQIDPLARDYLQNMQEMATTIVNELSK